MKRLVSGAVALLAAGWTGSAPAADIPYQSRAPYTVNQPLNAYSWAGPYLGANLGWFCQGLREEVVLRLASTDGLRVLARQTGLPQPEFPGLVVGGSVRGTPDRKSVV